MRIAVAQHRIRAHERMDLAALLSVAEHAAEDDVRLIVFPSIPGLCYGVGLMEAFAVNVVERAPQLSFIAPCAGDRAITRGPVDTGLGRTLVLSGDDCFDPGLFPDIESMALEALVWQALTDSPAQAEAAMELALDASLSLAGLVIVAGVSGEARGVRSFGGSAIACRGDLLAEAGDGECLLTAEIETPVTLPARRGSRPTPAPVLLQRLSAPRS